MPRQTSWSSRSALAVVQAHDAVGEAMSDGRWAMGEGPWNGGGGTQLVSWRREGAIEVCEGSMREVRADLACQCTRAPVHQGTDSRGGRWRHPGAIVFGRVNTN
jgi:hypothetical protein